MRQEAEQHPLVQAALDTFPGATIETVRDIATDLEGTPANDIGADNHGNEKA